MPELMNAGLLYKAGVLSGEHTKKGHPPPFGERQVPLAPIIFRTKNTEKSRLGKIGKNFGKKFAGKCFGVRESPQSCGKGARGAKI